MQNQKMTVLIVEPGKPPRVDTITDTLDNLQHIVGGTIEAFYPLKITDPDIVCICNDESKFNGSKWNRTLRTPEGQPYDVVCGTFLITSTNKEDSAELDSLNAEQIRICSDIFAEIEDTTQPTPPPFYQIMPFSIINEGETDAEGKPLKGYPFEEYCGASKPNEEDPI